MSVEREEQNTISLNTTLTQLCYLEIKSKTGAKLSTLALSHSIQTCPLTATELSVVTSVPTTSTQQNPWLGKSTLCNISMHKSLDFAGVPLAQPLPPV